VDVDLVKRIFNPKGGWSRVFSIVRFLAMFIGAGIMSVYFVTGGNIFAAVGFAITSYVLFRYGQIKGYIK